LEVRPIVDNDEGPKGENIDENEDDVEDNDDYPTFLYESIPWIVCIKH